MIRSICAGIFAVVAWFVAATAGNWVLRALMPGYIDAEPAMAFTLAMQLARIAVGLVASLCAGAVCAAIAGAGSRAVKIVAGVMILLFLPAHYRLWDKFPIWYHVVFIATLAPAVLAGAALQRVLVTGRSGSGQPNTT
jgi:hypothetical protein